MAERKSDKERLEFFKRWHHLPEASWAAEMSHLDKEERQRVRESLSDPDDPSMGEGEW